MSHTEPLQTNSLEKLEQQLRNLSHSDKAIHLIQAFASNLKKTKHRQEIFGLQGALLRPPIDYLEMQQKGLIQADEDPFQLLQGDIVSTNAAYFLGERIAGNKYAIASSSCDLVPRRREFAVLLRLHPIRQSDPHAAQLLGELLKFTSTSRMYLPALPEEPEDILAYAVLFDGLVQIQLKDLLLATRHASLSLVGWRIFGSLLRSVLARAGDSEVQMRSGLS